ncbi:MAG: MATE family efflux transporter [Lachnospiraceae bacterium]|nr:MATE family efflux transporter [Candidatus Equihabitans merdae]
MEMRYGNLWKQIMTFSIPLMLTHLLEMFFNTADVAIVGKFSGPISLGAVGSTSTLLYMITCFPIGLAGGINAVTALFIGADEKEKEHACIHTAFLISLVAGFLVLAIGQAATRPVLAALNTKPELIDEAVLYMRIYLAGTPALALFNFGNAIFSAVGETKKPLKYLSISGIINVLLNLVFVIVLHMAAAGVGLASAISQYLSAILVIGALLREKGNHALRLRELHFDKKMAGRILAVGLPGAFQHCLFSFANLFVQRSVNSFSHIIVEGNAAAGNGDNIMYTLMTGFYTACSSFIAQNLGARKRSRVIKTYVITCCYAILFGASFIIGANIFRESFLSIFTSDPEVFVAGYPRLMVLGLSGFLSVFMDNGSAAARGLNKPLMPTIFTFLGTVVFRLAWIFLVFEKVHTLNSLYIIYPISWIITSIPINIYLYLRFRQIPEETLEAAPNSI